MVNFSLNAGSLMGIILAVSGAGLYFLRSFRPNLARDYDVFFAAIALLCGGILFFQSWRLDPILQFGVFLLAGSAVFFAVDSIRLRSIATEQAKRNTPIVDNDRPSSRRNYSYQAELDDYDSFDSFEERQPVARRIRGSRDSRSSAYLDEQEPESYRRVASPSRRSNRSYGRDESYGRDDNWDDNDSGRDSGRDDRSESRSRRVRSRSDIVPPGDQAWDDWDSQDNDSRRSRSQSSSGSSRRSSGSEGTPRGPGRRRPPSSVVSRAASRTSARSDVDPSSYADYKPVDSSEDEFDNSSNFDD